MSLTTTQEQILDAALLCIVRDGIDGASLRKVAREAEVSLGLLSYHFDDKQTLIVAAFQLACDRVLSKAVDALGTTDRPDERVRAFLRGAFDDEFLEPDYLAMRVSLWAISRTDEEIASVERSLYKRYADRLTVLIAEALPSLDARDAADRATDCIVTQNGLWLNWARHNSRSDLERGLDRCESIALAEL